jgi:predicted DNA-binding protein with PD1-like motif
MIPQFLRLEGRTVLEEALRRVFEERHIGSGFFRATGVLRDVELRSYDGREGGAGPLRKLPGTWMLVSLEGAIGTFQGDVSFGLRAVLSREGECGMEMAAGEIVTAQSLGLEGVLWGSEAVVVRSRDDVAGIWLLEGSPLGTALTGPARFGPPKGATLPIPSPDATREPAVNYSQGKQAPRGSTPPTEPAAKGGGERRKAPPTLASADWTAVAEASAEQDPSHSTFAPPAGPKTAADRRADLIRPARPMMGGTTADPGLIPARGDIAEHFAFGRCEVIKTEGERIHLKLERDGKIKEIALEMLRVKEVDSATPGRRRFKLERKI